MEKEHLLLLLELFLNETGMYYRFQEFLEDKGYSLYEIGIEQ
jgi:hypothetical protein